MRELKSVTDVNNSNVFEYLNSERAIKVLVVQNGARHHYAVPILLNQAGMLAGFYTDICGSVGLGRILAWGRHLPRVGTSFRRLHRRFLPSSTAAYTTTFPISSSVDSFVNRVSGGCLHTHLTERRMAAHGFCGANMIYSSLGWSHQFLVQAKKSGLKVVTEFYVRPSHLKTVREESLAFPDWEPANSQSDADDNIDTEMDPCTVSDYVIVPSKGVADEVERIHQFPRSRIHVIPYSVNHTFLNTPNQPVPGRILFAGTCCLGKGVHYLAMAAEILRKRGCCYDIRLAGNVTDQVRSQPLCHNLTFLGRVPRAHIHKEYNLADVLVLPSLSEGSASVTYEALAVGIPQVVTHAAGSVARDGIEGRLVPERDPVALADAIESIVEDRNLRGRMAHAARERAQDYTWERYGERLAFVLSNIAG